MPDQGADADRRAGAAEAEARRGRAAEGPGQVPPRGWLDIALRVKQGLGEDNISIAAAGVAFFAFLSVFPALAAITALYGAVVEPSQAAEQIAALDRFLPASAEQLLTQQLERLARTADQALTIGGLIAVLVAIWSANRGTKALMTALNMAYGEHEDRGVVKIHAVSLGLTFLGVVSALLALALIALLPMLAGVLGPAAPLVEGLSWLRWPVLLGGLLLMLAVCYRYGPDRRPPRWQWVTPGALVAAVLWLLGSLLFSLYVSTIGSYEETYGSLGAVAVLMMWIYVTAFVTLLGAEINAEAERQTRRDSTVPPAKPLGERDAYAADTVGPSRKESKG